MARAANDERHNRHSCTCGDGERAAMKTRQSGSASEGSFGENTMDPPPEAARIKRRASIAPEWRLNRSTNSAPNRRSNSPANGTRTISFLMTKANRAGKTA